MDVIWWVAAGLGAIAVNLIASELFAWGPRPSEWLLRRAVRRLAPEMQERMHHEWAGLLQTIPPGLWRIVEAAGFSLATRQINLALRLRERQEKAEEKTPWEKIRENLEGNEATAFDVDIKLSVGMGKSALMSQYLKDYIKVGKKHRLKEGNKVLFIGLYPGDEPEPASNPPSPKR